jgi:uncharacterized protein (TIGR02285 family)
VKPQHLVFIFFVFLATLFGADKKILWVEYNLIPNSILDGPFKGEGVSQKVRMEIQNAFDSYDYTIEENTISRLMKMYKKYPNVCAVVTRSKIREEFIYFSKAFNWVLPIGLIIRADDLEKYRPYLNAKNEIILDRLIDSKKFIVGYEDKRSYGDYINAQIASNHTLMKLTTSYEKQMLMLVRYKRIDALFDYAMRVGYYSKVNGYKLLYLPIENMQIRTVHIGCSKSKFSKQFIDAINPYIVQHRNSTFLKYNLQWHDRSAQEILKNKIRLLSKDTTQ